MAKVGKNYKLGDVVVIPLSQYGYSYARIYRDGDFGIYDIVTRDVISLEEVALHKISFFQNGTDKAIRSGEWLVLGSLPFEQVEDAHAPPQATCYIRESNEWTMGQPRVVYKGETLIAAPDQVNGLDIMSVCHRPELIIMVIIDRLVKGNHDLYRVQS